MSPGPTMQEGPHTQWISISKHAKCIKIRANCFLTDHYHHALFSSVWHVTFKLNNNFVFMLCHFLATFKCSCELRDGLLDFPKPKAVSFLSDEPKGLSHRGNCTIEYLTKKMKKYQVLKGQQTEKNSITVCYRQYHYAQAKDFKWQTNQQLLFLQKSN